MTRPPTFRPLVFELDRPGLDGAAPPPCEVPTDDLPDARWLREDLPLPSICEPEVVRHYTALSQEDFGVDTGMFPLGSCTMKYNPKVNELVAALPGFAELHPLQPASTLQGALAVLHEVQTWLGRITGLPAVSLQPAAGAQAQLAGLQMVRGWHRDVGQGHRTVLVVTDSAHGSNPASAAMCGYTVRTVRSDSRANVDLAHLDRLISPELGVFMLTVPNTFGVFDEHLHEVSRRVHAAGGVVFVDGANLNALMGIVRLSDLGADLAQLNTHKTFSTPHGGGGPGGGAIAATERFAPYLPVPVVVRRETPDGPDFALDWDQPKSVGKVHAFFGNFAISLRALAYLRRLGGPGLRAAAEHAVLAANYVLARLRTHYDVPYDRLCMHECLLTAGRQAVHGVTARDIGKRLMDYGVHPPNLSLPSTIRDPLLIEPTETESRASLDAYVAAMVAVAVEAATAPDAVRRAPHTRRVGRVTMPEQTRIETLRWRR